MQHVRRLGYGHGRRLESRCVMHYHAAVMLVYQWLLSQNIYKAVVAWAVGIILGAVFVQRPWRKHREAQETISDQLNADTPGGLETVVSAINELRDTLAAQGKDEPHEDNSGGA